MQTAFVLQKFLTVKGLLVCNIIFLCYNNNMSSTRFYNGCFLSFENGNFNITYGDVVVEKNKIVAAGGKAAKCENNINLNGNLLMGGFVNCHTHSPMTLLRGFGDDKPLLKWLHEDIFPREALLTNEDIYWGTRLAVLEYLSCGTTSCCDMYFGEQSLAQAMIDSGFRCVSVDGCLDIFGQDTEKIVAETEKKFAEFNKLNPLYSYRLGMHGEYTATKKLLQKLAEVAKRLNQPISMHLSESIEEVEECKKKNNTSPVEELDNYEILRGGIAAHCVHLSDNDIKILADKSMSVAINSCSNAKLASGIAPVKKMMEAKINICLGTDGAASNNSLDMWQEMKTTVLMQRLLCKDASVLGAKEALTFATVNGAKALNIKDLSGDVRCGALADLVVVDLSLPHNRPVNDLVGNLVFCGSKSNVILTMVDGKVRYEKGKFFVGEDVKKIYEECSRIAAKLKTGKDINAKT